MSTSVRAMVCAVLVPVQDRRSRRTYQVPRSVARWIESEGVNRQILDKNDSAGTIASILQVAEQLVNECAAFAERSILADVSEDVALRMLPHEVYVDMMEAEELFAQSRKRKPSRMTAKHPKKKKKA